VKLTIKEKKIMSRKKIFAVILAVLIALVTTAVVLAATITVDHFETGPQVVEIQVPCNGCSVTTSGYTSGTNILGGERDIVVTATGIPGGGSGFWNRVQVNTASDGILAMSSDGGVKGEMLVVWDGVDNDATVISTTGLNGMDLTGAGTNGGFIVRTTFADLAVSATLRVYSNTNSAQATFGIPRDINTNFVDFYVPFSQFTGDTSVINNAGAIAFYVNGENSPGADVYFHLLELTSTLELGDLPEDATHFYSTTLANNGARHEPRTGLRLGDRLDAETDGQPNLSATGDNVTAVDTADDEEGVTRGPRLSGTNPEKWMPGAFLTGFGGSVNVTVNGACSSSVVCHLRGWIDWNANGVLESSEVVITHTTDIFAFYTNGDFTSPAANVARYFDIPASPACFGGTCYARFRLCGGVGGTSTSDCDSPDGPSTTGEVEDYAWVFGTNAVTLESLQAQSTTSPIVPVALIGVSALALIGVVFVVRRRKTA
jgi:hypothetical protein